MAGLPHRTQSAGRGSVSTSMVLGEGLGAVGGGAGAGLGDVYFRFGQPLFPGVQLGSVHADRLGDVAGGEAEAAA